MKKSILILLTVCTWILDLAASDCYIALNPMVMHSAAQDGNPEIDSYIVNRLRTLVSNSNNLGAVDNAQFAITLEYDIIDKQIVDGAPRKILYSINASLNITDLNSKQIYSAINKKLKGIGNNEQKAILNAFGKISPSDIQLQNFIEQGRVKIIQYYDDNYQSIITKAQSLASIKRYDEAIFNLLMIPDCCVGYANAVDSMSEIYQLFVNQHCNENLAQARAAWIASPNKDGAISASVFLSEIYPDASCYGDALELADEIKKHMGEEWKFEMKRWDDNVSLERQRINAMSSIGIAYANSQRRSSTK